MPDSRRGSERERDAGELRRRRDKMGDCLKESGDSGFVNHGSSEVTPLGTIITSEILDERSGKGQPPAQTSKTEVQLIDVKARWKYCRVTPSMMVFDRRKAIGVLI